MNIKDLLPEFDLDPSRSIRKPCPKCGTPITLTPVHECPDDWINRIATWASCDKCAELKALQNKALSLLFHACHRLVAYKHAVKLWSQDKEDGAIVGPEPDPPGDSTYNQTQIGAAFFNRYCRLKFGHGIRPPSDLAADIRSSPSEIKHILHAYKQAYQKASQEHQEAAYKPS